MSHVAATPGAAIISHLRFYAYSGCAPIRHCDLAKGPGTLLLACTYSPSMRSLEDPLGCFTHSCFTHVSLTFHPHFTCIWLRLFCFMFHPMDSYCLVRLRLGETPFCRSSLCCPTFSIRWSLNQLRGGFASFALYSLCTIAFCLLGFALPYVEKSHRRLAPPVFSFTLCCSVQSLHRMSVHSITAKTPARSLSWPCINCYPQSL